MNSYNEWVENTLKRARETYGFRDQVAVSGEELNELAAILCKYQRYSSHDEAMKSIRTRVIEEVADVEIVLNHIYDIFEISDAEILDNVMRKVDRLERWLDSGKGLEYSMKDRGLKEVGALNGIEGI